MTATLIPSQSSGILLKNISWKTYESLVNELAQQGGIRLTYDRGNLEIMTPSAPHEKYKKILGRFVESVSDELNVEICSLGSLTCRREDLARGLEPDQCYYIENENVDLVVEIDVTSSSIDRLSLYASLGVPEVWRYDGNRLIIYQLEAQEYVERTVSPTFPFLSQVEMLRFLELRRTTKENTLIRLFREWVRSQIQSGE